MSRGPKWAYSDLPRRARLDSELMAHDGEPN